MKRLIPIPFLFCVCVLGCGGAAVDSNGTDGPWQFPFSDVTDLSGVRFDHAHGGLGRDHLPEAFGAGLALFDADADGDLDLYLVQSGPLPGAAAGETEPRTPAANRFYINLGNGIFDDATDRSGLGDTGYGMGVAVGDYDGDGAPDVYVANYGANVLYHNLGDGTFQPVHAGVDDSAWSLGAAFLDADGDQDLDLYVVNFLDYDPASGGCRGVGRTACDPQSWPRQGDRLYLNQDGRFTSAELSSTPDFSGPPGLGPPTGDLRTWGRTFLDVEGDGDFDLAVARGAANGTGVQLPNQLFFNDAAGLGPPAGTAPRRFPGPALTSRGVAAGDLDGDGDPDLVVTNNDGAARVWRNEHAHPERFLVVDLRGAGGNTSAYGAVLEAEVGERRLRREIRGATGYATHQSPRLHLGLGEVPKPAALTVRWPDGTVEKAGSLTGGWRITWNQGQGVVAKTPLRRIR